MSKEDGMSEWYETISGLICRDHETGTQLASAAYLNALEAEVERLKKYKALADEAVPMISKLAGPHRVEWLANYTALKETT